MPDAPEPPHAVPTPPPPDPEPEPEVTLEEWIAATQSCCAGPPDDGE